MPIIYIGRVSNMKKWIAATILISLLFTFSAALAAEKDPLEIEVKKMYSAPQEDSNLIYDIPVEVKLLDISPDGNWYKVKIAFFIGPFGYTYVGWTHIPVADVLSQQDGEAAEVATTPQDS
jgi:hypothetical protein